MRFELSHIRYPYVDSALLVLDLDGFIEVICPKSSATYWSIDRHTFCVGLVPPLLLEAPKRATKL